MLLDGAARGFLEPGDDPGGGKADRAAEQGVARQPGANADLVARNHTVNGRDHRNVLKRIYDVEKIAKGGAGFLVLPDLVERQRCRFGHAVIIRFVTDWQGGAGQTFPDSPGKTCPSAA